MISEQAKQRMRDLASRYPVARSAVMPALYIAQQEEGYITQEALQAVAEAIGITVDDVESVATFYTMYYQQPPGRKVIKVCTSISCYLRNCDALMIESNHDLEMLRGGPYPWSVKQRVMSRVGHLSNEALAQFFASDYDGGAAFLVLAHLSECNNHPELARETAERALAPRGKLLGNRVMLASQSEPMESIRL